MSALSPILMEIGQASVVECLAMEEALLEACDTGEIPGVLGFWEPASLAVVVGYANSVHREVNLAVCDGAGVDVFRRCSGGGTVLQMPGVLNYTVILPIPETGDLTTLSDTNRWMMQRLANALESLPGMSGRITTRGITDLCLDDRKCVGNAQRRKRTALLFHGSILLNASIATMETYLAFPSQTPDYRSQRTHTDFCVNLAVGSHEVRRVIGSSFAGREGAVTLPVQRMRRLLEEKYGRREWHRRS